MLGLSLLSLVGCSNGPFAAPLGSTVSLQEMEEYKFALDGAYLVPADQIGALLKFYALVTAASDFASESTGGVSPLPNVQVEIFSGWTEAYIIPESAVRAVDDYEVECEESGASDDPKDPCNAWFDETDQQWIEFGGEYTDLEGFRPTYLSDATDNRGLVDFYVFIDSVPVDEDGQPIDFSVYATIGVAEDTFTFEF